MGNRDIHEILTYHEATKHSPQSVRSSRYTLDWENRPLPFKIYPDLDPIPLPRDFAEPAIPALTAIAGRSTANSGSGDARSPDLPALSRVLQLSAGITKRKRHPGGEIYLRAYANTGALHHVDLYLVTGDLGALPAGAYHFGPHDFALTRLREGDWRGVLVEASGGDPELERAPVVVVSASTYWRNSWKYQARAWRHCFWDAGTLHANLLAVAATEQLAPRIVLGWADGPVERLLGLDPRREGALTCVPLGQALRPAPPASSPTELRLATRPLSRTEVDFPEIRRAHAASSLVDRDEARTWRGKASERKEPAPKGALTRLRLDSSPPGESLDRVIRRRGSTRAFDRARSISFAALSRALECASADIPADFLAPPEGALLDLYLIVNAVEGLAPGSYSYRRAERSLELLREGRFRSEAGHLALDQPLAADAAVDVYSLVDLTRVLDRFGNRGYRAAQLEGGITGGRLYLAAYAQGFGATGLTFYDDEVTEFFSPHAAGKSVMFLVALGYANRTALGLVR
jgi:SagB-type dehydrogenase family enzyme